MLATRQLIDAPGLSGFAPVDPSGTATYLAALLSLVDIYLIWHMLLLIIGVKLGNSLSLVKAASGVIITLGIVVGVEALLAYLVGKLGSLTIIRPFF